jgi:CRP-like cAMP-binding protein
MNQGTLGVPIDASDPVNRRPSDGARSPTTFAYAASTTSYRSGEPMRIRTGSGDCWGRIVRGAARLCVQQNSDHRRIIDFLLPGDFLDPAACWPGFEPEAACDGTVMAVYRNRAAERWADADVPREVREFSLAMASRFQRQILIFGRNTAMGKLCAFLVDMEQRSARNQPDMIVLPMSRYDIADYLAISVETVSRGLTTLRARGAITLIRKREIRILDRAAFDNARDR